MDYNTTSSFDAFEPQLSPEAQQLLRQASGWAMFLSVIGFILIALSLLGALSMLAVSDIIDSAQSAGGANNPMGGIISGASIGLITLIFTILWFFPVFFMYKFASKTRQALNNNMGADLIKAFRGLRSYFMFLGILVIISIITYIGWIIFFMSQVSSRMGEM